MVVAFFRELFGAGKLWGYEVLQPDYRWWLVCG